MKKFGILALVLLLILTSTSVAFAEPSIWAKEEVDLARANNLIVAEADQNYQAFITRELFCKLIVRMVEEQRGQPIELLMTNPFVDTDSEEIVKAYQMGIVKGVSATQFAPKNLITRQEVAVMMMRAFRVLDNINETGYTQNVNVSGITFSDQGQIADWALQDVREAFVLGIIKGIGDNTINPLGNTTVEQSIMLSYRLFRRYAKDELGSPIEGSADDTATPADDTATPADDTATPAEDTTAPAEDTTAPAEDTTAPAEDTTAPAGDNETPAGDSATPTGNSIEEQGGKTDGYKDLMEANIPAVISDGPNLELSTNIAPVAIVDNLVIKLRADISNYIVVDRLVNDPDGDTLTFVSVEQTSTGNNQLAIDAYVDDSIMNLRPSDEADVGKFADFSAVVSDGEKETTITFKVVIIAKDTKVAARFEPLVWNVKKYEESCLPYIDFLEGTISDSASVGTIFPSGMNVFGELKTGILPPDSKCLKFTPNYSADLDSKTKEYEVDFSKGDGTIERVTIIINYDLNTYVPSDQ